MRHLNLSFCRSAAAAAGRVQAGLLGSVWFWVLLLAGCAQVPVAPPLAGMAWDVGGQRILPFAEVLQQAGAADIVLLGETHDNPEHHAIELAILDALATMRTGTLVLEQYDLEQQPALDAIARSGDSDMARLAALERLMPAGWEWPGYQPLLATAVRLGLPVVAANASRATLRQVSKEGFAVLGPGRGMQLGLDTDWSPARQSLLSSEIAEGHCGSLPAPAVTAIALAQRARDALMADRILAQPSKPVIAILGRGHVRRDLAVPFYLQQRVGNRRFISVGLVEAGDSAAATDYEKSSLGALYDFIVFTKPVRRKADPCAGFAPAAVGPP